MQDAYREMVAAQGDEKALKKLRDQWKPLLELDQEYMGETAADAFKRKFGMGL